MGSCCIKKKNDRSSVPKGGMRDIVMLEETNYKPEKSKPEKK